MEMLSKSSAGCLTFGEQVVNGIQSPRAMFARDEFFSSQIGDIHGFALASKDDLWARQ